MFVIVNWEAGTIPTFSYYSENRVTGWVRDTVDPFSPACLNPEPPPARITTDTQSCRNKTWLTLRSVFDHFRAWCVDQVSGFAFLHVRDSVTHRELWALISVSVLRPLSSAFYIYICISVINIAPWSISESWIVHWIILKF